MPVDERTVKMLELALHHGTGDAEADQAFRAARKYIKRDGLTFSDFVKGKDPNFEEHHSSHQWTGWAGPKEQPAPKPRKPRAPRAKPSASESTPNPHEAKNPNKKYTLVTLQYPKNIYKMKTGLADATERFHALHGNHYPIYKTHTQKNWVFSVVLGEKTAHGKRYSEKLGEDKDITGIYWDT